MQNKIKGKQGEKIALKYLLNNNYKILDTNFHYSKIAEIDIVAKKDDKIIFVEVKTRSNENCGRPIEAVDIKKVQNIILASKYFIQKNNIKNLKPQIDVISIIMNSKKFKLEHIKNIVL